MKMNFFRDDVKHNRVRAGEPAPHAADGAQLGHQQGRARQDSRTREDPRAAGGKQTQIQVGKVRNLGFFILIHLRSTSSAPLAISSSPTDCVVVPFSFGFSFSSSLSPSPPLSVRPIITDLKYFTQVLGFERFEQEKIKNVVLPIGPEVKVECGGEQEESAGVDHERLRVGVEGRAVEFAHGDVGGERRDRRDDGHGAEYLAHLVGLDAATE